MFNFFLSKKIALILNIAIFMPIFILFFLSSFALNPIFSYHSPLLDVFFLTYLNI